MKFSKTKLFAFVLCFLLLFTFAGCTFGTYTENKGKPDITIGGQQAGNQGGELTPGSSEQSDRYMATLYVGSQQYKPGYNNVQVEWVNKYNTRIRYVAALDADGVAVAGENIEEGEYYVHLLNLPEQYTYDPTGYIATPELRHVYIIISPLSRPSSGNGQDWYGSDGSAYRIVTGTYRAVINKPSQVVHYFYTPGAGRYTITSLADPFIDEVRPVMTRYNGSSDFVNPYSAQIIRNYAEPQGSYTRNFAYEIYNTKSYTGGTYCFTIGAEQKYSQYPVYVDFRIQYIGEAPETLGYQTIEANRDKPEFKQAEEGQGDYHYANYPSGGLAFDKNYYRFNPNTGYYHRYDVTKYKESVYGEGFGPVVYCDLTDTTPCYRGTSLFDAANYEEKQLSAFGEVTVTRNRLLLNVKYLSVDYDESKYDEDYNPADKDGIFLKYTKDKDDSDSTKYQWNFTKFITEDYYGIRNSDGRVPVTKELKIFLQLYAQAYWFWSDNMFDSSFAGMTPELRGYTATQDSFWLFACGYYE